MTWMNQIWIEAIAQIEEQNPEFVKLHFDVSPVGTTRFDVVVSGDSALCEMATRPYWVDSLRDCVRLAAGRSESRREAREACEDPAWPILRVSMGVPSLLVGATSTASEQQAPLGPVEIRDAIGEALPMEKLGPLETIAPNEAKAVELMAPDTLESERMLRTCLRVWAMLDGKNRAYGNSAFDPVRCFSKSDKIEQIRVRIDDKLSRLMRGSAAGEDPELDLIGYLVILKVAEIWEM